MTRSFVRANGPRGKVTKSLLSLAFSVALVLVPAGATADTSGGQASAYLAYRQSANACSVWSPLFMNDAGGWTSSMIIRNEGSTASTVEFRLRSVTGATPINRSISIAQFAQREITPADLSLPSGFQGSLAATANVCGELSAVSYHDASGRNRMTLESPVEADTFITVPLAFNDYNGWTSLVAVQNTDRNTDANITVTYRSMELGEIEVPLTVRRDSSALLDLSVAPKGPLTVQFDNKSGTQNLVASAYHVGPNGLADANNSFAAKEGALKVFVPLAFRKYNGYDSGIRVVNITDGGGAQPRVSFFDRDTNERVATVTAPNTLRQGQETTFYLPAIDGLRDDRVYSVIVESEAGGSPVLAAVGNHVNYTRNTAMLYSGTARGDTSLTATIVYRAVSGLNSGIQIQNTTGSNTSATVRFRNPAGTNVATETVTVPGNSSATIYLPAVANLPDNFTGFAEVTSPANVAAVVNAVRYTGATTSPSTGT
jgi:hypothetical protein